MSIWEEDFSHVKRVIDDLKAAGVQNFREYFAAHPEFVEQAIGMVRILDVNEATVKLFGARDKQELLVSLDKILTPEAQQVFVDELVALAEGRTWLESQTFLKTLKGEHLAVVFNDNVSNRQRQFGQRAGEHHGRDGAEARGGGAASGAGRARTCQPRDDVGRNGGVDRA